MPVWEFEQFHGIVLTKIVRSNKKYTIALIETKPKEKFHAYKLNDIYLLIKYSGQPKKTKENSWFWRFTFNKNELNFLKGHPGTHVALVAGHSRLNDNMHPWYACRLEPTQIDEIVNKEKNNDQTILLRYIRNKISIKGKKEIFVSANSIENWKLPGS